MIEKLLLDGFNNLLNLVIDEGIKLFLTFIVSIYEIADKVLDLPVVENGILISQGIALAILVPKVIKESLMIYILRMNGDSAAEDPFQLLKGTVQSVIVITSVPWIVRYIFKIGTTLAGDVASLPGYTPKESGSFLEAIVQSAQQALTFQFFLAVAVVVMLIMIVVVVIQTFVRAGEIVMQAVTGSFMALGLTDNTSSSYSTWMKEMIALCVTQAAQLYMMRVAFSSLHAVTFDDPFFSIMLFLAMIWVAIKTPSIIKSIAHSTGVGRVLGGGSQQVVSTMLMRKMAMK